MKILVLRTDKPEAELYIYDGDKKLAELKWQAHLKLAETLNPKIEELFNMLAPPQNPSGAVGNRIAEHRDFGTGLSISAKDLQGIVCYKGPGSFTGLRIGLSLANSMAYAYDIPVVATVGEDWIKQGINKLAAGQNDKIALPEYGRPATTTRPKK